MGESSDELQIRIGVSVDGVDQATRKTDQTQTRVQALKPQIVAADRESRLVERRLHHLQRHMLRTVGRQIVAGAMTEGVEGLFPTSDLNGMALMRQLGTNVAMQSIFMSNLSAGAYIGILFTAIQGIEKTIEFVKEKVRAFEEHDKFLNQFVQKMEERFRHQMAEIEARLTEEVQRLRERNYAFYRSHF